MEPSAGSGSSGAAPPSKAPPAKKAKRGAKPKARRTETAAKVAEELQKLRPLLRQIGEVLLDRLEGQLAGLALYLEGESLPVERTPLPPAPILAAMLASVRELKVKPKKGRVKDLARIEALLEELVARMPPGA